MSDANAQKIEHRALPAANLRSLEDVPVEGGRISAKPIWRSDNLMFSPSEQIEALKHQGLTTAIDLRAPDEVQMNSTSVLQEHKVEHLHRPMTRKAADPKTLAETFRNVTTAEEVGDWYFRLTRARASTLLQCFQDISQSEGGVVFYCAAGKDRTGVLAACLLLFLGASDEDIVEDYAKTRRVLTQIHERQEYSTGRPALSREFPHHPILHADPRSMRRFLQSIRNSGGVEVVLAKGSQYQSSNSNSLEGTDAKIPYSLTEVAAIRAQLQASLVR